MAKYYTPTKLSENIRETPEGFLVCMGVPICRTGEMVYGKDETPLEPDEEGKVLIYRDAEEVFHVNTIASYEGKAFTIQHPEDFVYPNNWSYLAKGVLQNVRRAEELDEDGEESLLADVLVMDQLAIKLIKSGLREVSCGYEAEYEQTGKGKGKQTNIIGNHLALVENGRAGESYAIQDHNKGKTTMSKLADNMKRLFAKAVDEAEASEKKDDAKAKDEGKESMDKSAMDELTKMVKDLGEKIEGMNKPKDEAPKKEEKKPEEESKDADPKEEKKPEEKESKDAEGDAKFEERLKALEAAVAKLLDMEKSEDADEEEEEGEESEDAAAEKEKEEKEKNKTGDSKATTGLEKTKNAKAFDSGDSPSVEPMTAERMNELNAAHWARK